MHLFECLNLLECDLGSIEQDIKEFSRWDPDSTAFRYPVDKRGNPSISDLRWINFRNLKELVERVSSLLDGISMDISDYLNAKHMMNL